MDALSLPSRATVQAVASRKVCRCSAHGDGHRVSLRKSFLHVQTNLKASFKVDSPMQLRSVTGRGGVLATLATEEEVDDAFPSKSESDDVTRSVLLLKTAAKTRKVPASEICEAFGTLRKRNVDPSNFLSILGGTKSPGRTWMLVFSGNEGKSDKPSGGKYFPVTAVQNFDQEASRIENGVYLGPLGALAFIGGFSWEKRKLSFFFHTLSLTVGSLGPFKFGIGNKDKQISKDDPFFIWYYADDEIIVARGRGGGGAFWVRCAKVGKSLK